MASALRISIAANIVLAGLVAALLWRGQPAATRARDIATSRPASTGRALAKSDGLAENFQLKSDEPKLTPTAVAQLEQAGISRSILASALLEDFNLRWDKRMLEMEQKRAPRRLSERDYIEIARLREAEKVRELKQALGEEGYLAWDKEQALRALNGAGLALSPEEAEHAYRLQREFDQKHKELQMAMEDGVADAADVGLLQTQAQEALDRELEKLFGKQRLEKMRGISDAITDVRGKYADLNPTPAQADEALRCEEGFRAREAALAERLKASPTDTANIAAELKTLSEAQDEKLRQLFGVEAYDNMKRENDPTYKTLKQFAGAWELKDQEIRSVYATLHAFQEQAERTRTAAAMSEAAGQKVNWREITSTIEQAEQQTEVGLQNLLGPERLRRLKLNGVLTTQTGRTSG